MEKNEKNPNAQSNVPENVSSDRRALLKGALAGTVAAGLAATVGKAEAATKVASGTTGVTKMSFEMPQRVQLTFNPNYQEITLDSIYEKLAQIFELAGCPACGMIGIIDDIRIDFATQPLLDQDAAVLFRDSKSICG